MSTIQLTAPQLQTKTGRGWLAALFVGAFAVACTEFVPVGLLPQIAVELGVSAGTAGQLVTANALVLAIGAPVLSTLLARVDQRRVLIIALAAFAAGHVLAAVAPSFPVLLASRIISGATMGLYLAVAIAAAARLGQPERKARAIATIVAGVSTATALGVPVSTLLGQGTSWRLALGGLAVLALASLVLNAAAVPVMVGEATHSLAERLNALRRRSVVIALAAIVVFWAATFTVFTYLVPLLEERAGLAGPAVTAVLFIAGLGAIGGNLIGGRLADARLRIGLGATAAVTTVALLLVLPGARSPLGAIALVAVWQLAAWSFVPAVQAALYQAAGPGADLALSFAVSAFNIGIVLGAGLGGFAIDAGGVIAVAALGGALSVAATAIVVAFLRQPGGTLLGQDTFALARWRPLVSTRFGPRSSARVG